MGAAPTQVFGDTLEVTRGAARLLIAEGLSPLAEFILPSGRRLDLCALDAAGRVTAVEVKVSLADLRGDGKWTDYLDWCDAFYFAGPPDFPADAFPAEEGLIAADAWGGAFLRPARALPALAPARRRALTQRFARIAAERLWRVHDPNAALS